MNSNNLFLDTLMNNVPDTIYFKDMSGRFVKNSLSHAKQFGVSNPSELIGKLDTDFAEESAKESILDDMSVITSGIPILNKLEKVNLINGKTLLVSTSKIPMVNSKNEIIGLFGISRDVTSQQELIKQKIKEKRINELNAYLLKQNQVLEEYAFITSHNLRGPITNILALIDMSESSTPPSQDFILENIKKSTYQLMDTTDNLYEVLNSGWTDRNSNEVLLFSEIYNKVIDELKPFFKFQEITFNKDFSSCESIT